MTGNEAAARVVLAAAPGFVSLAGMAIPIAPAIIGVSATLLVRAPLIKMRTADISVTLLAMLGAFVAIVDNNLGAGSAFWIGIGFGGMGSGLIQAGKSAMATTLKGRLGAAFGILFNAKGEQE